MKFTWKQSSRGSSRMGTLTDFVRFREYKLKTPHVLLYTSEGTVPHLTYEVLQMITKESQGLYLPLQHIAHLESRMTIFDNIANFIGMNEYFTYCSIADPGKKPQALPSLKNEVSIPGRHGKHTFNAENYMKLIKALKPDIFASLYDNRVDSKSNNKKSRKCADNTVSFFQKCKDIFIESKELQNSHLLGVLSGGYSEEAREICSKEIGSSTAFGVIIEGLDDYSSDIPNFDENRNIISLIEASLKHVTEEKLRIMHGCWNPKMVLELIDLGIDLIDTSYPYLATEQNKAFVFPNDNSVFEDIEGNEFIDSLQEELKVNGDNVSTTEPVKKKLKLRNKVDGWFISLSDPVYAESFTPISSKCTCLTCRKHTKAYLHHLVNVKELLGQVLLMIHNLHYYMQFFNTIREAQELGKFQEFKNYFKLRYA